MQVSTNMNKVLRAIAVLAAMTAGSVTHATVTSYSTWGAYNAATSSNTTIDFEAQQTSGGSGGATYYGSSLTVGGVTFTDNADRLFVLSAGYYGDPFTSNYLNNNAVGSQINVNFVNPVYGFAMDLGTIYNWGGGPLQLTFNFAGSSETINLPGVLNNHGAPLSFSGFTSDSAFSSISISDPTNGLAIDNFTFASAAPVPEPETYAMLLAGLGLIGAIARRHKATQA